MEEERAENMPPEEPAYKPRPRWQIWLARLGLLIFLTFLVLYYITIYTGGR